MKHQYIMGVLRSFLKVIGLPEVGRFFLPISQGDFDHFLATEGPKHIVWMQREAAEQNPAVLQLLPYMVIRDKKGRLFNYQRAKGIGENRLLGKKSIGVGGHIDLTGHIAHLVAESSVSEHVESYTTNVIMQGLQTELKEELSGIEVFEHAAIRPIGFLLDDVQMSDDTDKVKLSVGRVHLGVVFEVVVPDVEVLQIKEEELIQLEPIDIYRDKIDHKQYENWSAMLLGFYRIQRNSDHLNSANHIAWDRDVDANRGRFYSFSASPYAVPFNLDMADGRFSLAQFEERENTLRTSLGLRLEEMGKASDKAFDEVRKLVPPHSPMDQTPWTKM